MSTEEALSKAQEHLGLVAPGIIEHNQYLLFEYGGTDLGVMGVIVDRETGHLTELLSIPTAWPDWVQEHFFGAIK